MPVVIMPKAATVVNVCLDSLEMVSTAQVRTEQVGCNYLLVESETTLFSAEYSFFPDIDECAGSNNCSSNANCIDNIGSYDCTCSAGYVGDGYSCDGKSVITISKV